MIVAPSTSSGTPNPNPAKPSQETLDEVRRNVRSLLLSSAAFRALPKDQQTAIARDTVSLAAYMAEPEGIKGNKLPTATSRGGRRDPYALGLADTATLPRSGGGAADEGKFVAQAALQGAAAAGAYLQAVNFPEFVAGLIKGVFHAIVQSSIEQMEAYGRLVADVAKTLNQFRDENVTENQGRDYLVSTYPDTFQVDIDTGEDGAAQPRVRVKDGVDESEALRKVNQLPVQGGPLTSLDDESEGKLVDAARTQLATSRQQLLATMVLMGINRIVVTDGRIAAKVLFDFKARDNFRYQRSATQFDYGEQYKTTGTGQYESSSEGGEKSSTYTKDKGWDSTSRDGSYYSKGEYKNTSEPVMTLASATQQTTDASLETKANLTGQVEVNFKSDYLPLEKMADSFQIGRIQDAAKPGRAQAAGAPAAGAAPATAATPPPASTTTPAAQPAAK
jgi:hypothetical protein